MSLNVLQVYKLCFDRTVGNRARQLIFLASDMRHETVIICAICFVQNIPLVCACLVDAAVGADAVIRDPSG